MNKLYYTLVLVFIGLFSLPAVATGHSKGKMLPMKHEKLAKPILLKDACKEVRIIEWRPTPGYVNSTRLTKKAVKTVSDTCNLTVKNFYRFIDSKGTYKIDKNTRAQPIDTSLSFMPAVMNRGGAFPRNLNDIKYRFAYRSDLDPLWGYFQRQTDWAYMRNDVFKDNGKINKGFVLVTAHELFHAMSYASGVYHQHRPASNKDEIEEELAEDFTESLGLGRN